MFSRCAVSLLIVAGVAFPLSAADLDITPAVLVNGDYRTLFHRVITVTGGTPPYTTLTVTNFEALGTGIAMPAIDVAAGTVTFHGTPTNEGGLHFTVMATDSAGASVSRSYDVAINFELGFNPAAIPGEAPPGFGLSMHIDIVYGTPPYTSLEVLDFDPGGTGTQAPVADLATGRVTFNSMVQSNGIIRFRLRATDSAGGIAEQSYSVIADSSPHFMPKTLPPGDAGALYGQVLHAVNGTSQCCASLSVTSFDDGGTGLAPPSTDHVAATVTFSSTPTAPGTARIGLRATTSTGATFDATYDVVINPAFTITPTTLPEGTVGEHYTQVIALSGGTAPITLIRLHGYSPAATGIPTPTIDRANGTITLDGIPTFPGVVNFDITGYDSANGAAFQELTLRVAAPISITPAALPEGEAGERYLQLMLVDGGSGPYTTFAVDGFTDGGTGLAPPIVNTAGHTIYFDSTPASAGTASFTVNLVDSYGRTLTKSYAILIHPALTITPAALPDGAVGAPYHQVITLSGGMAPFSAFSVELDAAGTGLANPAFDVNAGTITLNGTPAAAGSVSLFVKKYGGLVRLYTFTIHPLRAPAGVVAAAVAPGSVLVIWNASDGASAYEVARSADGVTYSIVGGTASHALSDTSVSANVAYLYRVRAASPSLSPWSAPDLATAIVFTDPSLSLLPMRAIHFVELRSAVNAVRTLAGLGAFTFADSTLVEAVHLTQLRSALAPARAALGLAPVVFARPTITPRVTVISAVDLEELRNGVK